MIALVPLHLLTGFLGAGKTTVLSRLLQEPRGESIAVLVNEIGELALDHHLLEHVDGDVVALPSGCLCCTMQGGFAEAIVRLLAHRPTRIVVETTGLADPAPILHALATDPRLAAAVTLASVVTVVDATRIDALLDSQPEVRRQLELADRVVVTKVELCPDRLGPVHELLATAAPGCDVREAPRGEIDAEWLFAAPSLARLRDRAAARLWLHHGEQRAACRTHSVQSETRARIDLVQLWLRLVTQFDGERLLRIKGLVECADDGGLFTVQSAGRAVSPPRRLQRPPAGVRGAQVVLIERGMTDAAMSAVITALRQAIAGERAS